MPEKMQLKKILVRNVVRVRNVAFLRNINYELLVRPLSRSIWCWFWKTGDPGSNPAEVLNVSISIFFVIEWFNFRIIFFLVSIIRRRTSWLLSYQKEGRPYWQRVKFTGVSASRVFLLKLYLLVLYLPNHGCLRLHPFLFARTQLHL